MIRLSLPEFGARGPRAVGIACSLFLHLALVGLALWVGPWLTTPLVWTAGEPLMVELPGEIPEGGAPVGNPALPPGLRIAASPAPGSKSAPARPPAPPPPAPKPIAELPPPRRALPPSPAPPPKAPALPEVEKVAPPPEPESAVGSPRPAPPLPKAPEPPQVATAPTLPDSKNLAELPSPELPLPGRKAPELPQVAKVVPAPEPETRIGVPPPAPPLPSAPETPRIAKIEPPPPTVEASPATPVLPAPGSQYVPGRLAPERKGATIALAPPESDTPPSLPSRPGGGGGIFRRGSRGIAEKPIPLNTRDTRYTDYFEKIRQKIQANWIYPREAGDRGIGGQLVIEFIIAKTGDLNFIELQRSSGVQVLDLYALNAVKLAQPFPPIPDSVTKGVLPILGRFTYQIVSADLLNQYIR